MSMISNLLSVRTEELESYIKDSSLLEDRIYDEENEIDEDINFLDLDKSWDGILYLLTGYGVEENPHVGDLNNPASIFFSGQLIDGEQDFGYGPAHYLTPEQVIPLEKTVSGLTREQLLEKFNPEEMSKQNVYPTLWHEGEEAFDYIYDGFETLQSFLKNAVAKNQGVISWIA